MQLQSEHDQRSPCLACTGGFGRLEFGNGCNVVGCFTTPSLAARSGALIRVARLLACIRFVRRLEQRGHFGLSGCSIVSRTRLTSSMVVTTIFPRLRSSSSNPISRFLRSGEHPDKNLILVGGQLLFHGCQKLRCRPRELAFFLQLFQTLVPAILGQQRTIKS